MEPFMEPSGRKAAAKAMSSDAAAPLLSPLAGPRAEDAGADHQVSLALPAVTMTARGANVPRAVADVLLVRGQRVEGRVARTGNGFVEDLRPLGRDLSNVRVGHRF